MSALGAAVSLGSMVVSLSFAAVVLRNFWERRKPYNLMWGVGLFMFTLVAFVQVVAELAGWSDALFRTWYVLGTSLVAFLGAGSVYIAHNKLGHAFAAYVLVLFLAFLAVAATAPTNAAVIASFGNPSGSGWAASTPRLFSPLFTIPGTATLVGIALYGFVRYRLTYNLWIGGGAIVLAVGTGLARFEIPWAIYLAEFVGIALMFVGFWKAVEWAKEHRAKSPAGGSPPTEHQGPEATVETAPK